MGRRGEILLLLDSDEELPNPSPPRPLHAAEGSRELQQSLTAGGSEKNPVLLSDSSLTAESEDGEDVDAGGSTEHRLAPSAGGSRKHRLAPSTGGSRKHLLGLSAGRSRNQQDVVAASGSRKRRRFISDGESRKHHLALSAGGSRNRQDAVAASGSRKLRSFVSDGGSRKHHHGSRKRQDADAVAGRRKKIPRRAVPDDFVISGPVTVVFHPGVIVVGSYNVLTADDGRVRICCWKNFIDRVGWKAKTKIVMLFCRLDDMTWLFVHPLNAVVMA